MNVRTYTKPKIKDLSCAFIIDIKNLKILQDKLFNYNCIWLNHKKDQYLDEPETIVDVISIDKNLIMSFIHLDPEYPLNEFIKNSPKYKSFKIIKGNKI